MNTFLYFITYKDFSYLPFSKTISLFSKWNACLSRKINKLCKIHYRIRGRTSGLIIWSSKGFSSPKGRSSGKSHYKYVLVERIVCGLLSGGWLLEGCGCWRGLGWREGWEWVWGQRSWHWLRIYLCIARVVHLKLYGV